MAVADFNIKAFDEEFGYASDWEMVERFYIETPKPMNYTQQDLTRNMREAIADYCKKHPTSWLARCEQRERNNIVWYVATYYEKLVHDVNKYRLNFPYFVKAYAGLLDENNTRLTKEYAQRKRDQEEYLKTHGKESERMKNEALLIVRQLSYFLCLIMKGIDIYNHTSETKSLDVKPEV